MAQAESWKPSNSRIGMTPLHKPLFSPPLQLVEAYLAYPLAGPHELAKLTGLTLGEVVEGLAKRDLPMSPLFDRELLHDPAT